MERCKTQKNFDLFLIVSFLDGDFFFVFRNDAVDTFAVETCKEIRFCCYFFYLEKWQEKFFVIAFDNKNILIWKQWFHGKGRLCLWIIETKNNWNQKRLDSFVSNEQNNNTTIKTISIPFWNDKLQYILLLIYMI